VPLAVTRLLRGANVAERDCGTYASTAEAAVTSGRVTRPRCKEAAGLERLAGPSRRMDTVRDRVDGRDPAGRAARHPARHHHRWPGRLWQRRRARLSSRSDRSRSREVPMTNRVRVNLANARELPELGAW